MREFHRPRGSGQPALSLTKGQLPCRPWRYRAGRRPRKHRPLGTRCGHGDWAARSSRRFSTKPRGCRRSPPPCSRNRTV